METHIVTGVYAKLENKPGTLRDAARVITDRNVNIESLSVETIGGTGYARFYTQKPREVLDALRHRGIEAFESAAVAVKIPDRPGELLRATSELAAAGINVESVNPTPDGQVVFRTSDVPRTEQILRKL